MNSSQPSKAERAVELATEKGSSNWLTVIPLKVLDYNVNKKELTINHFVCKWFYFQVFSDKDYKP